MRLFRVYWLTCALLMAFATVASATTIVLPTDEQLIKKSPVIVEGTVVSSAAVARGTEIRTETKLAVERSLKGNVTGEITISEIGGELDNRITKIFGSPEYVVGERVLVFLAPTPRGDYQTMDLFVGKFSANRAMNGRKLWLRDTAQVNVTLLDSAFRSIEARNVQRDGAGFENFVANVVAGKSGEANYGLENPILESEIAKPRGTLQPIVGNFTLLSEPNIYRWFAFERGQTVRWYSQGTQPGYSGGGVSEISAGIAPWNSAPGARIAYSYSGTTTSAPGGLSSPNGRNEVLLNDPMSEISGSWSPSTGGVVGQGGFNGVTYGGAWTSTFSADSTHPQRTYASAYDIVEGNLTIQDNVSPTAGISSTRLAEIIAHEFGHTLGFGHTPDNANLMFASITGRGPTLGADDQTAAQWLYPSGSSTPPPATTPPLAPSNLSGSASGSSQINLQWSDNSNNEAGFYIYVAYNGGAATRVSGSFSAGATSGALTGASPGSYQIYLKAYNSAGESAASNTATVTVAPAAPPVVAFFNMSPGSGIANVTTFAFTDATSGSVTSRLWTFGDGTTSSQTNPTKMYTAAGSYLVTLSVNAGTATAASYSASVSVGATSTPAVPTVQAAFDVPTSGLVVGNALTFTDRSTGSPTAWSWNFGDLSAASTAQNPSHAYSAPGTYTIILTAQNSATKSTVSRTVTITDKSVLTLNNSRYRVTISARDHRTGKTATGQATVQTSEFGYFSLPELTGNPNNPEVFVKVLGPVNGVPWVFFGGLTDVEYTLTVTDTETGAVRTYYHAPGDAKGGYDTGGGQGPAGACAANTITEGRTSLIRATATTEQLSMLGSRFGMSLSARDPRTGRSAAGVTLPMNDESGFYTLPGLTGNADNIEVFVKIINATSVDGRHWVFFGGLTDFEYTLTVFDTTTGKVRNYTKPAGSACGGFDTTSF